MILPKSVKSKTFIYTLLSLRFKNICPQQRVTNIFLIVQKKSTKYRHKTHTSMRRKRDTSTWKSLTSSKCSTKRIFIRQSLVPEQIKRLFPSMAPLTTRHGTTPPFFPRLRLHLLPVQKASVFITFFYVSFNIC